MAKKVVKKLPPCPWAGIGAKSPYTIHRVVMPHKLTKGGNWMGDRWD